MRQLPYIRLFPNKYSIPPGFSQKNPLYFKDVPKDTGFIDQLTNDIEYIPIPKRIAESEPFAELAIEYSTLSATALEVKQ